MRAHFGGAVDADGEVLGVVPLLDGLDHRALQVCAERGQLLVVVELRPEPCPTGVMPSRQVIVANLPDAVQHCKPAAACHRH